MNLISKKKLTLIFGPTFKPKTKKYINVIRNV